MKGFFFALLMKFSSGIWKLFVPPSWPTIRRRSSKWQFLYLGRRGGKGECWGHWEWNVAEIWILIGRQYPLSLPIKKEQRPPRADGQHFRAHKIKLGDRGEVQLDLSLLSLFSFWSGVVSLNALPAGLPFFWLDVHHWKLIGWGFECRWTCPWGLHVTPTCPWGDNHGGWHLSLSESKALCQEMLWNCGIVQVGKALQGHRVQPSPSTAKATAKHCPQVSHPHSFLISAVMVTPALLWAGCSCA